MSGIPRANSRAMKLSIVPPTSWDFEFDTSLKRHPRAVRRRRHQRGAGTGSRRPEHRDSDLSAELTVDRSPRLAMADFQIAAIELRDYPGQQVAAQVLGGGHPHGLVVVDDQRFQRGAPLHGRKPGQPIVLVAERRMNLFDSCWRVGRHIERTRHSKPNSLSSYRITDPPGGPRKSASAPTARVARWSAECEDPGTVRGIRPTPGSWSATAWSEAGRRDR